VGSVLWVPGQNAVVRVTAVQASPSAGTTTVTLQAPVQLAALPSLTQGSATLASGPVALTPANVSTFVLGYWWNGSDLDAFLLDKGWDPDTVCRLAGALQAQAAAPQASNVVLAFQQQLGFFGRTATASSYYQVTAVSSNNATPPTYTENAFSSNLTWTPQAGSVALSWAAWTPPSGSTLAHYNVYRSYGPGAPPGPSGGALLGSVPAGTTTYSDNFAGWSDTGGRNVRDIWTSSGGASYTSQSPPVDVVLEQRVPGLLPNSTLVVNDPSQPTGSPSTFAYTIAGAVDASVSGYGTTLTTTGLTLASSDKTVKLLARNSTAWVQSRPLQLTSTVPSPTTPLQGSSTVTLNGLCLGLATGQLVMLSGPRADAPSLVATELLTLAGVVHSGGYTQLTFTTQLQYSYVLASATLSANVAPATHGQTSAGEIIGSGDGTQANQTFTLARTGLTFVATPSGPATTLGVEVSDVAWQEVPSLEGQTPHATVYTVRLDDTGHVGITFGDGVNGARLPTGQENVAATYRTGTGVAGDVGAGSLTLLLNRPFGVRGVSNPLPAAGGVDPETLDEARANAPRRMRTLGRIVSLSDYEDFAITFPGIAKAHAGTLSNGVTTVVVLTVAGVGGVELDSTSAVWQGLHGAILAAGDPRVTVQINAYQPAFFGLAATLAAAAGQDPAALSAAALAALVAAFSFDQRDFAEGVAAAEVIAQIQRVPGVLGVTLTQLFRTDASSPPASPPPQLLSAADGELLLLSAIRATLTVEVPS
jgi:hypothetical protein